MENKFCPWVEILKFYDNYKNLSPIFPSQSGSSAPVDPVLKSVSCTLDGVEKSYEETYEGEFAERDAADILTNEFDVPNIEDLSFDGERFTSEQLAQKEVLWLEGQDIVTDPEQSFLFKFGQEVDENGYLTGEFVSYTYSAPESIMPEKTALDVLLELNLISKTSEQIKIDDVQSAASALDGYDATWLQGKTVKQILSIKISYNGVSKVSSFTLDKDASSALYVIFKNDYSSWESNYQTQSSFENNIITAEYINSADTTYQEIDLVNRPISFLKSKSIYGYVQGATPKTYEEMLLEDAGNSITFTYLDNEYTFTGQPIAPAEKAFYKVVPDAVAKEVLQLKQDDGTWLDYGASTWTFTSKKASWLEGKEFSCDN